jgi:DNA helicase-2/ATP-dependent DNA helicase PcrA
MRLNEAQAAVVACRSPRILVLAGAGTGKTATSVHWVAELIKSGTPRSQVLMITFTRKAASEMSKRIEGLLSNVPKIGPRDSLTIGTYHSVASTLLRADGKKFGFSDNSFSTIDETEAQSIWKSSLKQCGFSTKSALFVPAKLHQLYSLARNTCVPVSDIFERDLKGGGKKLLKVVTSYEELKKAANVADYDDLLVLWEKRLREDEAFATALRARWKYVLVDEMQDNNQLNAGLLDVLNPEHLLVVGDANQSIYGFRGSDVSIIRSFTQKNPGTMLLKLEDNYRSAQPILDVANRLVAETESALHLINSSGREGKVQYRLYQNNVAEADGLARWILERTARGLKPNTCAVLSRSSKTLDAVEIALRTHKIFYKKYGGQMLGDASEIKDFIAFLRIAHNLQDKIALLRALTQFPGIGEGTAAKAIQQHENDLFGEVTWPEQARELPDWIQELRSIHTLGDQGKYLEQKIGPLILHNYPKDGDERMATIKTLVTSMEPMEGKLVDFLDNFVLNRSTDDYHPDDCVTLSTVHSAKGLEWEGVWVVGSGATQIPHPRSLESAKEKEEELRLFYVAVTRAKTELVISYPGITEKKGSQSGTPFLPENTAWKYSS